MTRRFRKKPVEVYAIRVSEIVDSVGAEHECLLPQWVLDALKSDPETDEGYGPDVPRLQTLPRSHVVVKTKQGQEVLAAADEWIVRAALDDLWPVAAEVFEATYEPAALSSPQGPDGGGSEEIERFDPEHEERRGGQAFALGNDAIVMELYDNGDFVRFTDHQAVADERDAIGNELVAAREENDKLQASLQAERDQAHQGDAELYTEVDDGHGNKSWQPTGETWAEALQEAREGEGARRIEGKQALAELQVEREAREEADEALGSLQNEFAAFREQMLTPLKDEGRSVEALSWDELLGVAMRNANEAMKEADRANRAEAALAQERERVLEEVRKALHKQAEIRRQRSVIARAKGDVELEVRWHRCANSIVAATNDALANLIPSEEGPSDA